MPNVLIKFSYQEYFVFNVWLFSLVLFGNSSFEQAVRPEYKLNFQYYIEYIIFAVRGNISELGLVVFKTDNVVKKLYRSMWTV